MLITNCFMKTTFLSILLLFVLVVNAQFPNPFCGENFPNGVLPITRVNFGSINNISPVNPAGPAHEDFTSVTANVIAGNTYIITVQGNTGGNLTDYYRVFFDWNNDGNFSYNENYYIGSITNSTGTDATFASTNITVPYNATGGAIRMRVSKLSSATVFICNNSGKGQAEDYTVVVSFPPPKTVYVKAGATGINNGSSWANAYTSLSVALDSIHERDTVKVAMGIYKPYTSANSFSLKDAAVLIGGYPASGNPMDADRNAGMFPTILSGELESSSPFDNALHVLYLQQVSNKTVVDGFIVENGYTRYSTMEPVGLGGGIYLVNASPMIRNCVFRNNLAELEGTAVAATGSNPQFIRCFFISNGDRTDNSSIYITNSNATFTNCVFAKNTGTTIFSDQSTLTVKSSTFEGNLFSTHVTGRGYCIFGQNNSNASVFNSIFFDNKSTIGSDSLEIKLIGNTPLVQKTITQVYNGTNASLNGVDPKFRDTSKIAGADNLFFTSDDGLQLMNPCSPAINNGDNNLVLGVNTDILGNPRTINTNTDLGAYEVQGNLLPVPKTIYVNKLASGTNDGSSWVNAYTEISRAIAACSDTIKVAAGTYYPSDSNAFANLVLQNHRIFLGGYPSSGNPTDAQRDPTIYPTIISGNLPHSSVHSMVLFRGRYLDSTCQVDGFILQEAVHDYYLAGSDNSYGAAIQLSQSASPQFSNCVFKNNLNGLQGGALIAKSQSDPQFYKCKFESDSAGKVTGINIISNTASSPRFIQCQFKNNRAVFFNDNSSPLIDSCVFSNNKGRSISNDNNSNPVISNSSFLNNEGPDYGNDLYNRASSPMISNCIFSSSFHTKNGGLVANIEKSSPVFDHCVFRNGYAEFYGGAIYNDNASPTFRKCAFANNYASSGGGMYSINHSQTNMIQCVIVLNTAGKGSALFNSKSMVSLLHCTISNNGKTVIYNTDSNRLDIRNTLFAENALAVSEAEVTDFGTPVSLTNIYNSLTWAYGTDGISGNIVRKKGRQWDNIDPDGPDDIFFTADDGAALSPCSPAVNAGENSFAFSISSDVLNNQRLYGNRVDIGAYELQQTSRALQNFFVNPKATGNNSGVDWQNAYNNIQLAFCNACADTVKVAEGIYKPALNDRDSSFFINLPLVVLGGYPDNGNPGNGLRDPFSHPTILSGDIGVPNDSLDNSKTILVALPVIDTILIDGLVIRDGNGGGGGISLNAKGGGGLFTYWNHTILRNCRFINNQASPYGGAISIDYMGDVDISGCEFDSNSSTNYGGALYFNGSKLSLRNSVFQNNYSYGYGGALKTETGNWEIVNSVFYKNFTTAQNANCYGGAVHAEKGIGTISNCNFVENRVEYAYGTGGGLFTNQSLAVQVKNCLFKGNSRGGSTTLAGADFDWINYNTVNHCLLQISRPYATDNKYSEDPLFVDLNNPAGPDGRWMTADDGFRLQYNSPAIDYGLNSWITESLDITKACLVLK